MSAIKPVAQADEQNGVFCSIFENSCSRELFNDQHIPVKEGFRDSAEERRSTVATALSVTIRSAEKPKSEGRPTGDSAVPCSESTVLSMYHKGRHDHT